MKFKKSSSICRPDTSRRQRRRLPACSLVIALVPLKWSSRYLQFPHWVPLTKENMHWCPWPFNSEAYKHAYVWTIDHIISIKLLWRKIFKLYLWSFDTGVLRTLSGLFNNWIEVVFDKTYGFNIVGKSPSKTTSCSHVSLKADFLGYTMDEEHHAQWVLSHYHYTEERIEICTVFFFPIKFLFPHKIFILYWLLWCKWLILV